MIDTIWGNDFLDDHGVFTEHMPENAPTYDFKRIKEYCVENNITLADMSFEEIEQFRSN